MSAAPIAVELASFDPSAERAARLDARMRERLAASVRHVVERARGRLKLPDDEAIAALYRRLERQPVHCQVFGAYYDAVLAIDAGDRVEAERCLSELVEPWPSSPGIEILDFRADPTNRALERYRRLFDTDPRTPMSILRPPSELALLTRQRIAEALGWLEASNPDLAAEIRGLVRQIVLAIGSDAPGQFDFDGGSCFMLWGALLLNVSSHQSRLDMVQVLAHESAHSHLFGLSADGPLVLNPDDELHPSPLRLDPRPIDGICHATFVSARMHQAVQRLLESGSLTTSERTRAQADSSRHVGCFYDGLTVVRTHGRLTAMGEAALAGAEAYMAAIALGR